MGSKVQGSLPSSPPMSFNLLFRTPNISWLSSPRVRSALRVGSSQSQHGQAGHLVPQSPAGLLAQDGRPQGCAGLDQAEPTARPTAPSFLVGPAEQKHSLTS